MEMENPIVDVEIKCSICESMTKNTTECSLCEKSCCASHIDPSRGICSNCVELMKANNISDEDNQ